MERRKEEEEKTEARLHLDLGAEDRGTDLNPEPPRTRPPLRAASAASKGTRNRVAAAKAAAARVFNPALSSSPLSFFHAATVTVGRAGRRGRALPRAGARRATGRIEAVILAAVGARRACMRVGKRRGRERGGRTRTLEQKKKKEETVGRIVCFEEKKNPVGHIVWKKD